MLAVTRLHQIAHNRNLVLRHGPNLHQIQTLHGIISHKLLLGIETYIYHINRVGGRHGPAFAFCSHHLTAHVGPLYERAETDRLFLRVLRESAPMGLTKESGKAGIDAAPIRACLRVIGYMRFRQQKANAGSVSLAHKGLPLPHCIQDILPSNLRKNFSYLAFWPCSISASRSKTVS